MCNSLRFGILVGVWFWVGFFFFFFFFFFLTYLVWLLCLFWFCFLGFFLLSVCNSLRFAVLVVF